MSKAKLFIGDKNRLDMDHINLFQTNAEFLSAYNGSDYVEPWVSYTMETSGISYNKGQTPSHDYSQDYLTFNIISSGTIYWKVANASSAQTIDYKLNNGDWVSLTSTTGGTPISVNAGDSVKFRGDNVRYGNLNDNNTFGSTTARFNVEGNIMSLVDSTGFTTATTLVSAFTFMKLFSGCTGLTSAENLVLPATTLTNYCYNSMFRGCTSLTTAPELPATALTSYCYESMFYGCTSLTTPPSSIGTSSTTLGSRDCCQYMFYNCTSLASAPELPATILTERCYSYMFRGCTSLTAAPDLPATTLTSYCYIGMFYGCTNLNYIKCLATNISAYNCTNYWVDGVSSTGTFVKPASMTDWRTGINGIPSNWTVQDA